MTYQFLSRLIEHHQERANDCSAAIRQLADVRLYPPAVIDPVVQTTRGLLNFHTSAVGNLQQLLNQVPAGKDLINPTTRQPIISR